MKIIEVKDYQQMSRLAACIISEKVRSQNRLNLGLATGETPKGTYNYLIKDFNHNGTSYEEVYTFNLDEYVPLSMDNPNSYRFYMNHFLFNHLDIPMSHTFLPLGNATDLENECVRYEKQIEDHGGIDLQLLGIGKNGHIGFNEPRTSFISKTHVVTLTSLTREANARFFERPEDVPKQAITVGIETIMKSKEILLLASGESKREAMNELLHGELSEDFPASILRLHPDVTVIADQTALKGIQVEGYSFTKC
ncbi:glucosamine-6-phosphate deaminase [Litchfieldia alkalitelluris]|uniref:glucosamine-6-phosphate deaminase n=1 Tax=Litchfieldia alkalitelluris TaxID=304268 RepID=UPI000998687D|nr:glucosamine-6-phosphate deaminase [Litchfieldia alkalitelluris]